MKLMSAGFLFSPDFFYVALIEKQNPPNQKGFWNAIGGKIEPEDKGCLKTTQNREFWEEAGVKDLEWNHFLDLSDKTQGWQVSFFYAVSSRIWECKTKTNEVVKVFRMDELPQNIMTNLYWAIPMAISFAGPGRSFGSYKIIEN